MKMAVKFYGNPTRNKMIQLTNTLATYETPDFKKTAKQEISLIDKSLLPLQQGLSLSSYVGSSPINVVILSTNNEDNLIKIKAGIFYTGIIAGCSCSDDPSPTDEQNEYCEILFSIDKETASTDIKLLNS